jgi:type IV pilus assembly protein PilB
MAHDELRGSKKGYHATAPRGVKPWPKHRLPSRGTLALATPVGGGGREAKRAEISRPAAPVAYHGPIVAKRIGELLVEAGVLSQSQLEQALFAQRKDGRKLGQLLIELGLVNEIQLTQTLSRQLAVPWVSLYHVDFSRSLLNLVAREVAERFCLVPIFVRRVRKQGDTLYVAMEDPTNEAAIEEVAKAAALPVKPMVACPSDIRAAIRVYYLGETAAAPAPGSSPIAVPPAPPSTTQLGPRPAPPPPPRDRPSQVGEPPAPPPTADLPPPRLKVAPVADPQEKAATDARDKASIPEARAKAPSMTDPREKTTIPDGRQKAPSSLDPRELGPDSRGPDAPGETRLPKRMRPRMISLTLLDGTSISIPAPGAKQPSRPDSDPSRAAPGVVVSDQLTARDLVSALRAVSHGVDASEILGTEPKWEALFAALLSVLLRKGLIADWEFIEEFRKV